MDITAVKWAKRLRVYIDRSDENTVFEIKSFVVSAKSIARLNAKCLNRIKKKKKTVDAVGELKKKTA